MAGDYQLTHQEQQHLKARHGRRTKDKRQADRLKAVYLLSGQ